jgi:hypothetical protein
MTNGNENKSGKTMGLANQSGNEEAPRDQDCLSIDYPKRDAGWSVQYKL